MADFNATTASTADRADRADDATHGHRVLILNQRDPRHPAAGGAEVHLLEVFGRLAARGWQVTLASGGLPGLPREERFGELRVLRLARPPLYFAQAARLCRRETRAGRVDLVVECLNKLPFYSPLYARCPVVPLCHHLFGATAFRQLPWPLAAVVWVAERPLARLYRGLPLLAISESTRLDLEERGFAAEAIHVVPCGAPRPEAPDLPPIPARPLRIVYLGRLEPYKRVDVLIEAYARLRPACPEAELVVVGRGSARRALERQARRLGADVRFTGFVSDAERDRILAASRVAAYPSAKEGWGLTVLECNGFGVPVVASDVPGLRESVRHEETGLLVPFGDVARLAEGLTRLLQDEQTCRRLSESAVAWAGRFDWDETARETERFLAGTIAAARSEQDGERRT